MEVNTIYNEDCLTTMSKMPDNFVDIIITSPPYNMNLRIVNGKYRSRQIVKEFSSKYDGFKDNFPIEIFYDTHKRILKEIIRVSKIAFYNISIVTGSKRAFFKIIGDFSDNLKDVIIWDKCHAEPAMQKNVLNRRTEFILIFEKPELAIKRQFDKCNFDRGTLDDIWCIQRERSVLKDNSAVFPEKLIGKIITNFSDKGDLVYDPFMGTGTTAKIAKQFNRKFIGSEISEKYCKAINKRISQEILF